MTATDRVTSLPLSKKLAEHVKCETEKVWRKFVYENNWRLVKNIPVSKDYYNSVPAFDLLDILAELPTHIVGNEMFKLEIVLYYNEIMYVSDVTDMCEKSIKFSSIDELTETAGELLLWYKEKNREEGEG